MFSSRWLCLRTSPRFPRLSPRPAFDLGSASRPDELALPLGIESLDAVLPDQGILRGGVVELAVSGPSGLATSLALHAVRAIQLAEKDALSGAWCAFVDPSSTLYAPGVRALGVDLERLLVVRPPLEALGRTAMKLAESPVFSLVVVDTLGTLGRSARRIARRLGSHRPAIVHGGRRHAPQRAARHRRKRATRSPASRRPAHRAVAAEQRKARRSRRQRSPGSHHPNARSRMPERRVAAVFLPELLCELVTAGSRERSEHPFGVHFRRAHDRLGSPPRGDRTARCRQSRGSALRCARGTEHRRGKRTRLEARDPSGDAGRHRTCARRRGGRRVRVRRDGRRALAGHRLARARRLRSPLRR